MKTINPNSINQIYDSDILNYFYSRYLNNNKKIHKSLKKKNHSLYFQNKVKKDLIKFFENKNKTICFRNEFKNLSKEKKRTLELYEKKIKNSIDPNKFKDYIRKNNKINFAQLTYFYKK